MLRTRAFTWGLVCAAALSTGLIWYWVDSAPLVWSGIIWVAVIVVFGLRSTASWQRTTLLSVAAALGGVVCAEATLWRIQARAENRMMEKVSYSLINDDALKNKHSIYLEEGPLGLRAPPGVSIEDAEKFGKATIFDVRYTFDRNGLRVGPPENSTTSGCVLFFGDSYAMGWGVSDKDAAPYKLGLMSGGSLKVYNFAFAGYGVHTMLAQLQDGVVRNIARCSPGEPVYAISQILPDYVTRARSSGIHGPRYILSGGTLTRRGRQGDGDYIVNDTIYISSLIFPMLKKVHLYVDTVGEGRAPDDFDTRRFVAIVVESKKEIQRQFPGAKFVVTVWDNFFPISKEMFSERRALEKALNGEGIDTLSIEQMLPRYDENPFKYCIPHEFHPNVEAHRIFAAYLFDHFIGHTAAELASSSIAVETASGHMK